MSLINEYRQTETAIKELQTRLDQLQGNEALQNELEFEKKLRALMGQYSKSLKDIILILDPAARDVKPAKLTRAIKPRELKRYKNPHTGVVVETKGGNHKVLKEWKAEYGAEQVASWQLA